MKYESGVDLIYVNRALQGRKCMRAPAAHISAYLKSVSPVSVPCLDFCKVQVSKALTLLHGCLPSIYSIVMSSGLSNIGRRYVSVP